MGFTARALYHAPKFKSETNQYPALMAVMVSITIKVSWDTDSNVIGAEDVTEIKTDLHNDGKSLDSDNFTVTWHGNIPTVTTHGEEQSDQSYTFNWK